MARIKLVMNERRIASFEAVKVLNRERHAPAAVEDEQDEDDESYVDAQEVPRASGSKARRRRSKRSPPASDSRDSLFEATA